jgi:hypothetical protein
MRQPNNNIKNSGKGGNMNRVWLISLLFSLSVLTGCGGNQSESEAKKTVEAYFELKKIGDEFAGNYLRGNAASRDLVDVFEYEYLSTLEANEKNVDESDNKDEFKTFYSLLDDRYSTPSWDQYTEEIHDVFGDDDDYIITEDNNYIEVTGKKDDEIKEYTFLYDMEIANSYGDKIYKKVEITVQYDYVFWDYKEEKYRDGFIITNINVR